MKRLLSRNAKLSLGALPFIVVGCALGVEGDPPDPVLNPTAGEGGEATGGSATTGGAMSTGGTTSTGGSSTGGADTGGSSTGGTDTGGSSTGGSSTGGSTTGGTMTGGGGGSPSTGGTAGKGTGGAMTGGTAGNAGKGTGGAMTGGTGGSAGKATGGTMTGGTGGGAAGGPPSGMELFRDNLESGASKWTPTPAANWAIATDGTMVYAATGAAANSNWRAAAAGDAAWTDVDISARVKVTSFAGSSTSFYGGICARYVSNSSYACFALRSDGKIAFRVSGNNTASVDPPGGAIATGTWYTVRVVARGANITAFLNGTEIPVGSRVTSGAPAAGKLAFACPGTNLVFDDVVVTTP